MKWAKSGGATPFVHPDEAELDPLSREDVLSSGDAALHKKIEIIEQFSQMEASDEGRRLTLRFLVSPTEFVEKNGHVGGLKLVKNELYRDRNGALRSKTTDNTEILECGLVFRSIGYRGVHLQGVPYNEQRGIFPNVEGRIIEEATNRPVVGLYCAGWIKRGPSGVIGTNKPDAVETANHMLADIVAGKVNTPTQPSSDAVENFIRERQPQFFSYADWQALDAIEVAEGEKNRTPPPQIHHY